MAEFEIEGKQLSQLRVVDLKQELEKRGLSKSGSKKELHDRLKMQLQLESLQQNVSKDEGHVPNLALQDDAIAEQSDVIKEYLAKQQQVYEMQKEARRQAEMEEELQKSKLNEPAQEEQEISEGTGEKEEAAAVESEVQESAVADTTLPVPAEETESNSQPEEKEYPSTSSDQTEASTTIPQIIAEEATATPEDTPEAEMKKDVKGEVKEILESDKENNKMSVKVDAITELTQSSFGEKQIEPDKLNTGVGKEPESEASSKVETEESKTAERESPMEVDKENVNASDGGNEAKPAEVGNQPAAVDARTFRPRIKREFFFSEASREPPDSSKDASDDDQDKAESTEVTKGEPTASAADSSVDVKQETTASSEQVTPHISRRQLKRRSNHKEEPKKAASRSRSHSSDSNSSRGRQRTRRKSVSNGSSSSRSSSAGSRKSQSSLHHESDSISSSGTSKKTRKHLPATYDRSPSPVSKMSEGETRDSLPVRDKDGAVNDRERSETQDNSASHMGEDNEESLDLETKPEETLEGQPNSEKDASNNSVGVVHVRKISLSSSRDSSNKENVEGAEGDRPARKRKWGSSASKSIMKTSYTISTDSLKTLIPDVAPPNAAAEFSFDTIKSSPHSDQEESAEVVPPKEVRIVRTVTQVGHGNEESTVENREKPKTEPIQYKPLSLMEDPIARPRSPSPARNPVSRIVHIRNLVRPFTLKQLKDLLCRTGTLVETGFWIDKIKSKCYATYETIEQAVETRQALHGTQWPPSNRKNLIVDYADEDELRFHMSLEYPAEPPKPPEKYPEPPVRDMTRRVREVAPPQPPIKGRDFGPTLPPPPIREWDREKIGERSPGEKERRKRMMSPPREKRREKGRGIRERKERRDKRKEEEEAPAKLLDDLFRKTKIAPCIYWLPLTNEQIKLREEERKQRQVEREKRRQQMKKDESEKGKPAPSRDAKKPKTEEVTHHRKRSSPPSHSRTRKR